MKLSENFTLEEVTRSDEAKRRGIKNNPGETELAHITETIACMAQPIRSIYNKPIKVTSGYRCKELNAAVGGAKTSQHTTGYALDIQPKDGDMRNLLRLVLVWARQNNFDQIILEQCDSLGVPKWIHIGWRHTIHGQRRQILTAKKTAGKWTYQNYKE